MISVCMITFNGEAYLEEQMASILPQLTQEDELLIGDDCSTDRTVRIIEAFGDSRIRLTVNASPIGVSGNIEEVLKRAKGEYIFLADQDDVWLPGKVETVLPHLQSGALLVMHDASLIDSEGQTIVPSYFALRNSSVSVLRNFCKNSFTGCFLAVRRELIDSALPFPKGTPHDWWLGLCAARTGRAVLEPSPLMQWRRHGGNATDILKGAEGNRWRQVIVRWRLLRRFLLGK